MRSASVIMPFPLVEGVGFEVPSYLEAWGMEVSFLGGGARIVSSLRLSPIATLTCRRDGVIDLHHVLDLLVHLSVERC